MSDIRVALLSDFNVQNFSVLLGKQKAQGNLHCSVAPYGRTVDLLLDHADPFWSPGYSAVVLWTLPERAVEAFNKVISFLPFSENEVLEGVDSFAALVQRAPESVPTIILPGWTISHAGRGWGPLDLCPERGVSATLMRMNLRLAEQFRGDPRVVVLDAQRWLNAGGPEAYNPKLWYLSKTPFNPSVLREAAADVAAAIAGARGASRKVVVLDLDDTLWGGTVGEMGWEKLKLGGHDPIGEAFLDFQRALKRLVNRGVLLALASKNEEAVALEALRRHPEMILRPEDFAAWRINWGDKAANIADMLAELNLGRDAAVFLDDSPFERARVREALPEVLVPDLPVEPMMYPSFLAGLRCFDSPFASAEDRNRTRMYMADRRRNSFRAELSSLSDWLAQLKLSVEADLLRDADLERAAQLFNKTNQMNLSTRRLTPHELKAWAAEDGHRMWTFRISDKFGDYGLCGIASLAMDGTRARLQDFLLSCRAMGREVEDAMLAVVAQDARALGCEEVQAQLISTPKNQPCGRWLQNQPGFERSKEGFRLSLSTAVHSPSHISITVRADDVEVAAQESL